MKIELNDKELPLSDGNTKNIISIYDANSKIMFRIVVDNPNELSVGTPGTVELDSGEITIMPHASNSVKIGRS